MATFGNTTDGNDEDSTGGNEYSTTCIFPMIENGDITKITLRIRSHDDAAHNGKTAIYTVAGGHPTGLLATSNEMAISGLANYDFAIAYSNVAGARDLALGFSVAGGWRNRITLVGGADQSAHNMEAYAGFPYDPFNVGGHHDYNRCIYATYTPSGGVTVKKGSIVPAMTALLTRFSALKQPREAKFQPRTFPKLTPRRL